MVLALLSWTLPLQQADGRSLAAPERGPDAPTPAVNPAHNGVQEGTLAPPLVRKWSYDTDEQQQFIGRTIIAGGRVYAMSQSRLHAFDVDDGARPWPAVDLGPSGVHGGIGYENGRIFAIRTHGLPDLAKEAIAVDATSGRLLWSRPMPQHFPGGSVVATGGRVYINDSHQLVALRASDGHELWAAPYGYGDASGPTTVAEGKVFVASSAGKFFALDAVTGALLWSHDNDLSTTSGASTAYHRGRLYVSGGSTGSVILDAATGKRIGAYAALTPPALDGDVGYFADEDEAEVRAEDLETHQVLWSTPMPDTPSQLGWPLLMNDYLYVSAKGGQLWALDARTGEPVWKDQAGPNPDNVWEFVGSVNAGNGIVTASAGPRLVVYGPPDLAVGRVAPPAGPAGTPVRVLGHGFLGATTVRFGAAEAVFTVIDDSTISAVAPAGSGTVEVTVKTPAGVSPSRRTARFTYAGVPAVTSIRPDRGAWSGGTRVSVEGSGLSAATAVAFGGVPARFHLVSDTELVVFSPPATALGATVVTVATPSGSTAAGEGFSYEVTPETVNPSTTFQINARHTGEQSGKLVPGLRKAWSRSGFGPQGVSYPVIARGRVYLISGSLLYALDAATGEDSWGPTDVGLALSHLAYDAGRLFATTQDGYLWAFDAETGAVEWFFDTRTYGPWSDARPPPRTGSW